ncbi:HAD family hydrolase [Litorivivens sp.]|uniref:HAD family hydrolase n=1 Tax=Litorivivens sp. TaxID=2020868 RepID=UPI0035678A1A
MTLPRLILFDWHGTLVDTADAMFSAMADMLPLLEELGLVKALLPESECVNEADARLVRYIRIFRRLHPRILAERRVSRTEIFNAIFGDNRAAKRTAHAAYNRCYQNHFGKVKPFQDGIYEYLSALKAAGIRLGVATNRSRQFLDYELQTVDGGRWQALFDTTVCADDVSEYKPEPEMLQRALADIGELAGDHVWYVADSMVDMQAARNAGIAGVFYNGGFWEVPALRLAFSGYKPRAVIASFEELFDILAGENPAVIDGVRPPPFPSPQPPPPRIEPDWHPAVARLLAPDVVLFDWHATLVDTLDAMYHAVDDMLPELASLGLTGRLVRPEDSRSPEDAKLVEYVQSYNRLHPKVRADRKISRTDIFEVLFGRDEEAKRIAHRAFNSHYRNHYGEVEPFEPKVRAMLEGLRKLPLKVGVITNRDREFFEHELASVEGSGWAELFDADVCGDDTPLRKPHPDQLLLAAEKVGAEPGRRVWYVGDSTTDIVAAKRAGMTAVFFNGALWDLPWLQKIFPGTEAHPHKPDVVVNDFSEFWALVLACERHRK